MRRNTISLAWASCWLLLLGIAGTAHALPGDPDEPALGPHEILAADRPSGTYWFDPDRSGPVAAFRGSYDEAEGGGWLMVLNYVHRGGTNPELLVRVDSLPLLGQTRLGIDESRSEHWGHAAPSVLNAFNVIEARFFGRTSSHERMIHFSSDYARAIAYFTTGSGSTPFISRAHALLAGHTARLPATANNGLADEGDFAMTTFPFWENNCCTWGIRGRHKLEPLPTDPPPNRWEVDDTFVDEPDAHRHDTIHRIWIRTASICGDGIAAVDEECDDDNLTDGDGCSGACKEEVGFLCRGEPSTCLPPYCGDGFISDGERCDDAGDTSGDGCNRVCGVEHGFSCVGEPSVCTSQCGDGVVARDEACDDGNQTDGDGCSAQCLKDDGWACPGEPSECLRDGADLELGAESGSACSTSLTSSVYPGAWPCILCFLGWVAIRRQRACPSPGSSLYLQPASCLPSPVSQRARSRAHRRPEQTPPLH